MKTHMLGGWLVAMVGLGSALCTNTLPAEPIAIGYVPQFFVDDYIVDNRWAINYGNASKEIVARVQHSPVKFERNPVIAPYITFNQIESTKPRPSAIYVSVLRDVQTGLFRMWYQLAMNPAGVYEKGKPAFPVRHIAYAESKDGMVWELPDVDPKTGRPDDPDRNVVWRGLENERADSPAIIEMPDAKKKGYKFVLLYLGRGVRIVGSHDGLNWDEKSVIRIANMHSDTSNSIIYDEARGEFVMYCRAKHIYHGAEEGILAAGESRRIARMASQDLWTEWKSKPQNIMVPDERDAETALTAFYGMNVKLHAGIYWGFLQSFRWNTEMESELAFSRDGIDFDRLPHRPRLIPLGANGEWDHGMMAVAPWVEVGEQWWLYYGAADGPHAIAVAPHGRVWRAGCIGLAKIRREGFISMRGPEHGGVIATRQIRWPGGGLLVNADASAGEMKVRVTDENRKEIPGFGYNDCVVFRGNGTREKISWQAQSMAALKGRIVRLEFYLRKADIFTFCASPE